MANKKVKVDLGSALMRKADGSTSKLVPPLDLITSFGSNFTRDDGNVEFVWVVGSFLNACTYYALEQMLNDDQTAYESTSKAHHLAVGRNTAQKGSGEDVCVEFQDMDEEGHPTVLVHYTPYDGSFMAAAIKPTTGKLENYFLTPPEVYFQVEGTSVGTPIWLAVLPELLANPKFAKEFTKFSEYLKKCDEELNAGGDTLRRDNAAFVENVLGLCSQMRELTYTTTDENVLVAMSVPSNTVGFHRLAENKIKGKSKKYVPSMSKVIFGTFEHFEPAGNFDSLKCRNGSYDREQVVSEICSQMVWTNPCTSPEEQALIPQVEGIITERIVNMVKQLVETRDNPLATRTRFYLIEGPAGVGKSFNARMFADLFKRPFVIQTISPSDQKEDLIGSIVPITHGADADLVAKAASLTDTEKKLLEVMNSTEESELYDKAAEALGYPSNDFVFFDPKGSYKQVTGLDTLPEDELITASAVIGLINREILSRIIAVGNKCQSSEAKIRAAQEEKIIADLKKVRSKALAIFIEAKAATDEARLNELKKEYAEIISDDKNSAYPPLDFDQLLDIFKTDIQLAMTFLPGYNGNAGDFLPKYEKELEVEYKFIPSPLVRAFKNGWVCELQEATCLQNPSALSGLHDALEPESLGVINTPYGDIRRHPDFCLIATQNRQYAGTKPLNAATRSRFQFFDCIERLTAVEVKARIKQKCDITDEDLLNQLADCYQLLESKAREERMSGEMTMRALYSMADALKRGYDRDFALEHFGYWAISTDEEDVAVLQSCVENITF